LHGLSAYAASKAALLAFSRSLAAEGRSRDVLCNAIAPYAATRMTSAHVTDPSEREATSPELVAPLVSALVSARSTVNGQVFVVGRGWARHAAVVELDPLIRVDGPSLAVDASTQLPRPLLDVPGACREYADGRASYADFGARVIAQHLQAGRDAE
jgi:hypothetical protein